MHPTEKESERVQQARVDYWREIEGIDPENLVFVDESGVNLGMTRRHARAEIGRRAHGDTPGQRGKNVSIVGAMALTGILCFYNIMGAYNTLSFDAFISISTTLIILNIHGGFNRRVAFLPRFKKTGLSSSRVFSSYFACVTCINARKLS